jgi:hypothetical protein
LGAAKGFNSISVEFKILVKEVDLQDGRWRWDGNCNKRERRTREE